MTSQYRRGSDFERKVKAALLAQGAIYVVRAAGSHGPADLIAFYNRWDGTTLYTVSDVEYRSRKPRPVEFVQAKRNGAMTKADRWALIELATQCGAVPVLASQGKRGQPVVFQVLEKAAA